MNEDMRPLEIEQEEMLPMAPAVFDISDELALYVPVLQDQDQVVDIFDESLQDTALDELLQHMESKDELILTDTASAPAGTIKQNDQDPQISFAELTASSSEPATQSDDLQADTLAAPQTIEMFDIAQLQPQLTAQAPLEKSDSSLAFLSGWQTTLIRIVVILLLIGCLWADKALAATSSTSSTFALLSNLFDPTPKATIDTLGRLAPTASPTSTSYHTPAAVKKTPTPTPTPRPTTTSTSRPLVLDPIATPKPAAPAQPQPTAVPQPATPVGKTIWLKSAATGDYVSAWLTAKDAPLEARSTSVSTQETFSWGIAN
jgi:hypothetical protein